MYVYAHEKTVTTTINKTTFEEFSGFVPPKPHVRSWYIVDAFMKEYNRFTEHAKPISSIFHSYDNEYILNVIFGILNTIQDHKYLIFILFYLSSREYKILSLKCLFVL